MRGSILKCFTGTVTHTRIVLFLYKYTDGASDVFHWKYCVHFKCSTERIKLNHQPTVTDCISLLYRIRKKTLEIKTSTGSGTLPKTLLWNELNCPLTLRDFLQEAARILRPGGFLKGRTILYLQLFSSSMGRFLLGKGGQHHFKQLRHFLKGAVT